MNSISPLVLAASHDPITGSSLFGIITTFFRGVGILIVVFVVWKVARDFFGGKKGEAARTAIVGFAVAAITFNLALPIQLAQGMGNLVRGAVELVSNIANSDSSTPPVSSGSSPSGSFPDDPFLQWEPGMVSPFSAEAIADLDLPDLSGIDFSTSGFNAPKD